MIISVSRRCDIPRFRFGWFLERLEAGFVEVSNPYNAAQIKTVSLKPADAGFLVFWTRDPGPVLAAREALENYPFYVMTTLTGYPKILEPNVPPVNEVIASMAALSKIYGSQRTVWRYDPIFLTSITDYKFHKSNFYELASRLGGITKRVIISIYDEYTGASRRIAALENKGRMKNEGRPENEVRFKMFQHYNVGIPGNDSAGIPGNDCANGGAGGGTGDSDNNRRLLPEIKDLVSELAGIADSAGMRIQSCAEDDLAGCGVEPGACIDCELIKKIRGETNNTAAELFGPDIRPDIRDKNQRPFCLCSQAVDIGSYGPCPAGCVYCYARR
ncbi:MAG: DUF1848 domain-containing protein [Treponema sp.]|nr:DUF1848 domain-containing protein [Treponema sp.]